jgi:hypothetical protein
MPLLTTAIIMLTSCLLLCYSLSSSQASLCYNDRGYLDLSSSTSWQSTGRDQFYRAAELAIDGVTDGDLFHGSVTSTLITDNPNWTFRLPHDTFIDKLRIWRRTDCCQQDLSPFRVELRNADMEHITRHGFTYINSVDFYE